MIFSFSSFIIHENNFTLSKNAQKIEIEPKIFTLLCYLCKNSNRAISRKELIEKVWQGRIISDAAVNRAIGELRKLIEIDVQKPLYIVTVSKVGYRFNAVVHLQESAKLIDKNTTNLPGTGKHPSHTVRRLIIFAFIATVLIVFLSYKLTVKSDLLFSLSKPTPLTTVKGNAFKQQMFKNGDVVFIHRNSKNKYAQLWLQPAGLTASKLTNDSYYYTHVIFKDADTIFATRFDSLKERNCQIVKITISNKHIEKITDCAKRAITHLAYNASSRKLYFNFRDQVSQPYSIRSIQLDTMRIQQLTNSNPEGNTRGDYLFSLSPNGKELAVFEYQQDGGAMLKVVDLSDIKIVKSYNIFYSVNGLDWLDNQTILTSDNEGVKSFNLITKKHQALLDSKGITQADYSQHLSLLSYVKFDATRNIYQLSHQDNKPAKALTHSPFTNFHPIYANTSDALVYLSTDSGKIDIQLIDQQNKVSTLHFPESIKHIVNMKWAKDDSFIIVSINSKLYQYSLHNKQWQEIKVNLKNIHYAEVMNNQNVIVSSDQSGDWQLWEVELASGNTKKMTKNGGYSANYVASNNTLLVSKYSQEGLFQFNLDTQLETKIKEDFKITDWNKWQVRGDNIYSWKSNYIVRRNLKTNKETTMWEIHEPNSYFFNINFNENKVAYKVTEQEKASVWKNTLSLSN
ncbi:winged helix-turn-helix domain-containing protein [Cognaticolwellia mytili]|uniref:winged helix-turn-helix domain-containing protein n=1 Tax=Cognaticolwellia mytili TaxID=1888913 RepID=UPI000A170982|nr:winged helix-turn-helix domain-containing protein [Cognaticolwellia mytili]